MLALAIVAIVALTSTALVGYLLTSQKADSAYRGLQNVTFAADGAMKSAINWAKDRDVGRDPVYTSDPACVYRDPNSKITVTCAAVANQNSGAPAETGKTPYDALLLLGQRSGEVPRYSPCTGSASNRSDPAGREVGLLVDPLLLQKNTSGVVECKRAANPVFVVEGNIRSNAPIRTNGGRLELSKPLTTATAKSNAITGGQPCIGSFSADFLSKCTTSTSTVVDPATGSSSADWRLGDINWNPGRVSINGGAAVQAVSGATLNTALAACNNSTTDLVRFYPGTYRDSDAMNKIFASTCANGVYWFSPAKDASQRTSTVTTDYANYALDPATAVQGVYVFDFQGGTGSACANLQNTNNPHRWCLGTSTSSLVVGGWPTGWNPDALVGTTTNSGTTSIDLAWANDVATNGSRFWCGDPSNCGTSVSKIDAADGNYAPPTVLGIPLPSNDRSITLSGWRTSQAGSAPTAVAPSTDVTITVVHREQRSARLSNPQIEVSTTDSAGNSYNCGRYSLPKSVDSATPGNRQSHKLSTNDSINQASGTTAERSRLKDCFSSADRISNVKVTWLVPGDEINSGGSQFCLIFCFYVPSTDPPKLALDGMTISLSAPTGGWFGSAAARPATYCDAKKPGVQFIFGGDSTVHAGQSALQVCAGPAPANPDDFQQIAIWGQPQNFLAKDSGSAAPTQTRTGKTGSASLLATTAAPVNFGGSDGGGGWKCNSSYSWKTVGGFENLDRVKNPGDPSGAGATTAKVNPGWCAPWYLIPPVQSTTTAFDLGGWGQLLPYSTCTTSDMCIDTAVQSIDKVILKVGYNSNCGAIFGTNLLCGGSSAGISLQIFSSSNTQLCDKGEAFPATSALGWYAVDVTSCFGGDVTAFNGMKVRISVNCNSCVNASKVIEGVETLVSLKTKANANAVAPAGGCRTSPSGYGTGAGDADDITGGFTGNLRGADCALISGGRVNIQGTVYAPSDAIEINDGEALYPFATRGLVARHLRVRQYVRGTGYGGPTISNTINNTRRPRQVTFKACLRPIASTEACGTKSGDRLVGQSLVSFELDPTWTSSSPPPSPTGGLRVPRIIAFTTQDPS